MTFDLPQFECRLEMAIWEHAMREEITDQLEGAYPSLRNEIEAEMDKLTFDAVKNAAHDSEAQLELADRLMASWKEVQSQIAIEKAEQSLLEVAARLKSVTGIRMNLQDVWPALREDGVLGPSMNQLPAVIQFPTLNAAVLQRTPVADFLKWIWFDMRGEIVDNLTKTRSRLTSNIQEIARQQLFANGRPLNEPCFLNKLQAAILKSADNLLQESV